MIAHHEVDHDDLHLHFRISKPTKDDIQKEINEYQPLPGETKMEIDLSDEGITRQIGKWQDIAWSVKIDAPALLKAADFHSFL